MRIVRTVAKAVAGLALIPGLALAQSNTGARSFSDSWFWGVKGGAMTFKIVDGNDSPRITAPSVGGEWLITRSRIALNLSVEQSFFEEVTGVFDPTVNGGFRPVDISDWRRYQASIFFFPGTWDGMRPYAGLGLAINVIQNATPQGTFESEESMEDVFTAVHEFSTRASAVFTGGMQYQLGRASLFGQANVMPTRTNFLINGAGYTYMFEFGVRWNLASSLMNTP